MSLLTDPIYSTLDDFKECTPITSQKTIDEADWKPWALRAEGIIDTYVNCVTPCKKDQERKFPTYNECGVCEVPRDVQLAAIEITSFLILQSQKSEEEILDPMESDVTEETWSATSYSRKKGSSSGGGGQTSIKTNMDLPPYAIRLLKPCRS